eukprot:SAG11_NODE_20680_length_440_cov_1.302053_1_plen_80_part_01
MCRSCGFSTVSPLAVHGTAIWWFNGLPGRVGSQRQAGWAKWRSELEGLTDLIHKGVQDTVQPFAFLHTKFSTKFETGFGT